MLPFKLNAQPEVMKSSTEQIKTICIHAITILVAQALGGLLDMCFLNTCFKLNYCYLLLGLASGGEQRSLAPLSSI